MRILIVTYVFPPLNAIGSHRPYSWARTWRDLGHEIDVLTVAKHSFDGAMDLERDMTGIRVHEVPYLPVARESSPAGSKVARWEKLKAITRRVRFSMGIFGDPRLLAYLPMVRRGAALCVKRSFDFIIATSPPEVPFMVARTLSRRARIPWIADFRDLWFQDMLLYRSKLASWLSGPLNRWLVNDAALLVTVSRGLEGRLSNYLGREVFVSYNGFFADEDEAQTIPHSDGKLHIIYTGRLYPGKQDPEPLIQALGKLRANIADLPQRLTLDVYGFDAPWFRSLVDRNGVQDCVTMHGFVPYRQSRGAQRSADLLLFIDWIETRTGGMLTGKLFEYLGSGRPILAIGPTKDSEAAKIIAESGCGATLTKVDEIFDYLKLFSSSPPLGVPLGAVKEYTRERQAEKLLTAIEQRLPSS